MDETTTRDLLKGRFAIALVSVRARECPNKLCGRRMVCQARIGHGGNFHDASGNCPNMTEAEWRAVALGIQRNGDAVIKPTVEEGEAARRREAGLDKLSWAERCRRWNSPEAVREREEAARREAAGSRITYAEMIWLSGKDGKLRRPGDYVGLHRRLVAAMAACGCACARGPKMEKCFCPALGETEEGWKVGSRAVGQ